MAELTKEVRTFVADEIAKLKREAAVSVDRAIRKALNDYFTQADYLRFERIPAFSGDIENLAGSEKLLIRFDKLPVTLVNGANQNVVVGEYSRIRITGPSAAYSTGGFTGGVDGKLLIVHNAVAFAWTIVNEAAGTTAENRITTLTGADVVMRAGTSAAVFVYDGTSSRWVLVAMN